MMFAALLGRSVGRIFPLLAGVLLVLAGLQILIVTIAAQQEERQSFALIAQLAPPFVQRMFGANMTAFLSFGGLSTFGFFHPVVMLTISLVAVFQATEIAGDIEDGHVDLLLARPVARHWLVSRSVVVMTLVPAVIAGWMIAALLAALAALAPDNAARPDLATLGALAAHLVAVAWCFGAIGLAFAAISRRRMTALGITALLTVSLYLLDLLGTLWSVTAPFAVISPFHYFPAPEVMAGTADTTRNLLVLGAATAAACTLAYWRFARRDL